MAPRYNFLLAFFVICLGCSSIPRPTEREPIYLHHIYDASFDEVWSATLGVLNSLNYNYPTADKDAGVIETDFKLSTSNKEFIFSGGQRFPKDLKSKIHISMLSSSESKTEVKINQDVYLDRGFLEGFERTPSDYLIEKIILYRIERTIFLQRKLNQLTTPHL